MSKDEDQNVLIKITTGDKQNMGVCYVLENKENNKVELRVNG